VRPLRLSQGLIVPSHPYLSRCLRTAPNLVEHLTYSLESRRPLVAWVLTAGSTSLATGRDIRIVRLLVGHDCGGWENGLFGFRSDGADAGL
jgi:hypothetical protein